MLRAVPDEKQERPVGRLLLPTAEDHFMRLLAKESKSQPKVFGSAVGPVSLGLREAYGVGKKCLAGCEALAPDATQIIGWACGHFHHERR